VPLALILALLLLTKLPNTVMAWAVKQWEGIKPKKKPRSVEESYDTDEEITVIGLKLRSEGSPPSLRLSVRQSSKPKEVVSTNV
jgi:hypothetical protein